MHLGFSLTKEERQDDTPAQKRIHELEQVIHNMYTAEMRTQDDFIQSSLSVRQRANIKRAFFESSVLFSDIHKKHIGVYYISLLIETLFPAFDLIRSQHVSLALSTITRTINHKLNYSNWYLEEDDTDLGGRFPFSALSLSPCVRLTSLQLFCTGTKETQLEA